MGVWGCGSGEEYLRWQNEGTWSTDHPGLPARQEWSIRREVQREARRRQKYVEQLHVRHREVEATIHHLEEHLQRLSDTIDQAAKAQDRDRLYRLGREYQEVEVRLKDLWEEWMQLTEELEGNCS